MLSTCVNHFRFIYTVHDITQRKFRVYCNFTFTGSYEVHDREYATR